MATTFTLIKTVTVGSGGAATIDFTSIPSTFTDLVCKMSARTDNSGTFFVYPRFNNDSTSIYSYRNLYGYNGAPYSDNSGGTTTSIQWGYINNSSLTASTFCNSEWYVPNYNLSNYKSTSSDGVMETNAANGVSVGMQANLWASTSAITRITLTPQSGNFVQYSTASLYGILKA